jgi:magnesium chelatase family protein
MVVMACNPCPCGEYSAVSPGNECNCSQQQRHHYARRVTGPVHDRIDILRHVLPPSKEHPPLPGEEPDTSLVVRERVAQARARQLTRYADREWRLNSQVPSAVLAREWPLPDAGAARLDREVLEGTLSRRGAVRVHRVAWTVADLRGRDRPSAADVDTAFRLRRGDPLTQVSVVRRAS